MKKLLLIFTVLFSLLLVIPNGVSANTVTLNPTADAFVSSYYPTQNLGTGSTLYTGYNLAGGGTQVYRSILVKFDLTSIPSNATVNSATLRLYLSGSTGATPYDIKLWRYLGNWSETTVTWSNQPGSTGTGIVTSVDASSGYKTWTVKDVVKNWVNGTYGNYGLLVSYNGTTAFEKAFSSRENGSNKPELVVDYTVPDTQAPTISGVSVSEVTQTGAKVTWNTDENSDSWVDYGTAVSYGSTSGQSDSVTSHVVTLGGLSANTTYHYRVRSKDGSGNQATGVDGTFTTASNAAPASTTPSTTTTTGTTTSGTTGTTGSTVTTQTETTGTATPSGTTGKGTNEAAKAVKFEGNNLTGGAMGAAIAVLLLLVVVLVVALLKKQAPKPVVEKTETVKEETKEEKKEETTKE